jgi:hypothetical protein
LFDIPLKFCPSCTVCLRDCPPLVCLDKQAVRQKKITASGNVGDSLNTTFLLSDYIHCLVARWNPSDTTNPEELGDLFEGDIAISRAKNGLLGESKRSIRVAR